MRIKLSSTLLLRFCLATVRSVISVDEEADWMRRFTQLIENTYFINSNRSVIIVAHSLGGLNMLYFLHNQSQVQAHCSAIARVN